MLNYRSRLFHNRDFDSSLFPPRNELFRSSNFVDDSDLKSILAGCTLGLWALSAETINFLAKRLAANRPTIVIECGSGVSTLVICTLLRRLTSAQYKPRLISFEQSEEHANATQTLLQENDLAEYATIIHAPLENQAVRSELRCYTNLLTRARDALNGEYCDFLLIDGPSGESGCRFSVLARLLPVLKPNTPVYMDDALRDGELGVAERWAQLSGVRVDGVVFVGKGLLQTTVLSHE